MKTVLSLQDYSDLTITLGRLEALLSVLLSTDWHAHRMTTLFEAVCIAHDLVLEAQKQAEVAEAGR